MKAAFSQYLKYLKLYQEEFDISIAQDDNFSDISVRMDSEELFDYSSDQGICYGQVDY
ncbi:hypothetical protein C1645_811744 [Glomus cerebriforme]|uniref:Uncharacterized protein n=1 Tax=Glomus cerebriforme TaxID=658196 RepID=A0A397TLZ0_9GLOM|nr:hypothetical protein C1645_811744 [Glomus cerebriforme]